MDATTYRRPLPRTAAIAGLAATMAFLHVARRLADGRHVARTWTAAHAPEEIVGEVEERLGRSLSEPEFDTFNVAFCAAYAVEAGRTTVE